MLIAQVAAQAAAQAAGQTAGPATQALPEWTAPLIALGAIVAALISATNALLVAMVNARASRRLALDSAHREYRASVTKLLRDDARECGVAFLDLYYECARVALNSQGVNFEPTREICQRALARLNEQPPPIPPTGNDVFDGAMAALASARLAARTSLLDEPSWDQAALTTLGDSAIAGYAATYAVELAAEGYVYQSTTATNRARRLMKAKLSNERLSGIVIHTAFPDVFAPLTWRERAMYWWRSRWNRE